MGLSPFRRFQTFGAPFVMSLSAAPPALAHGSFDDVAPFWSGLLHVLATPLALTIIVGLACALVRSPSRAVFWGWIAFLAASFAASCFSLTAFASAAAFGAILAGLSAALSIRLNTAAGAGLGLIAGAAVSIAAGVDAPGPLSALGLSLTALVLCVGLVELIERLPKALQLAPRIAGAWVAAIGLLIAALAFKEGLSS